MTGKVADIQSFGAFVTLEGGIDGLVHISRMSTERVEDVNDVLTVGQEVKVRITEVCRGATYTHARTRRRVSHPSPPQICAAGPRHLSGFLMCVAFRCASSSVASFLFVFRDTTDRPRRRQARARDDAVRRGPGLQRRRRSVPRAVF